MSGVRTTESALINVTGAIISGSAMPATRPYSAVAAATLMPEDTRSWGITRAVRDAPREDIMRVAERGIVRRVKSLKPLGLVNLPPATKYRTARMITQRASESVIAKAMPFAPRMLATMPLAKITARIMRTTSSISSVEENATKFLRPQNQLRRDAYRVDVTSEGSIIKNMGKHSGLENMGESLSPSANNTAQIMPDKDRPRIIEAVVREFCFLISPFTDASATLRERTTGAPAVIVKSIKSTLKAIWYCPTTSAPSVRDIHILNTKDISLVAIEKPVTMVKDLAVLVLFIPKEYVDFKLIINN